MPQPTPTIRPGKRILKNASICTWSHGYKENDGSSNYGRSNTVCAQSATRRSPRSRDGTAITFSGDPREGQTELKTASCFIRPVINKFIARVYMWRNRVRSHGRNERLEPYVEKFTSTVLRGGMAVTPFPYPTLEARFTIWNGDTRFRYASHH